MANNNSIYCAEQVTCIQIHMRQEGSQSATLPSLSQIVIPIDLGDILKAYTKEVIRRQPGDLVDFSAK